MVNSEKIYQVCKKGKGKVLMKGLTGIFALKAIQNCQAGFKIQSYEKKHHTWDCGCLGSSLRLFENQL